MLNSQQPTKPGRLVTWDLTLLYESEPRLDDLINQIKTRLQSKDNEPFLWSTPPAGLNVTPRPCSRQLEVNCPQTLDYKILFLNVSFACETLFALTVKAGLNMQQSFTRESVEKLNETISSLNTTLATAEVQPKCFNAFSLPRDPERSYLFSYLLRVDDKYKVHIIPGQDVDYSWKSVTCLFSERDLEGMRTGNISACQPKVACDDGKVYIGGSCSRPTMMLIQAIGASGVSTWDFSNALQDVITTSNMFQRQDLVLRQDPSCCLANNSGGWNPQDTVGFYGVYDVRQSMVPSEDNTTLPIITELKDSIRLLSLGNLSVVQNRIKSMKLCFIVDDEEEEEEEDDDDDDNVEEVAMVKEIFGPWVGMKETGPKSALRAMATVG